MQWLNNIMNWGSTATQSTGSSGAGFGLGQPLVTGDVGNASYAQGSGSGMDWRGLLSSAAKGYQAGVANQPQVRALEAQSNPMGFGSGFEHQGSQAISGLLLSQQNRAES